MFGLVQDVSEDQHAKIELERHRILLEEMSSISGVGAWEYETATNRLRWSKQTRRIHEVDDTFEPTPESLRARFPQRSLEIQEASVQRATRTGLPTASEYDILTAKGRSIRVRNVVRVEHSEGQITRLVGTTQDITRQHELERSLGRAQKLLEDISLLTGVGGWEVSIPSGEITWTNQVRRIFEADDAFIPTNEAIAKLLTAEAEMALLHTRLKVAVDAADLRVWEIDLETGVMQWDPHAPPTFVGPEMEPLLRASSSLDFIHPDDRDAFSQLTGTVVLSDVPSVCRVRARAPDGSFRHVEIRMCLSSLYADKRKILGVSRDVTRDVMLNEELVRKKREAEQASLAKSQFVARMSHEIRTPMSGVIGMLEVLQRAEIDPANHAHATTALKSARDLMSVLDDIIDASQLESRHLSLEIAPFRLSAVVNDVASLFDSLARNKSLTLAASVEASVPEWVMGDARRVRQVLTNLVGNAVKFTDAGGIEITLRYDANQQVALLVVRDTGIGIAEEKVDKIFDQFFQADSSTTRRHSGSGLGLAISKQLVGLMGGTIQVHSKLGAGSAFHFTIAAPVSASPSAGNVEPPATPDKHLRILVAEDNRAMQEILRALLEAGGHQLTFVSNGRDAVAMAASRTFDVILMDVMMPMVDGPTAAQRIRELGGRAGGIPIIAMTANALVGDRDRYIAAGMTDYLSKPIDVAALFAALARATAVD